MKKLLLCLAVVTLSGCNNLSKNLVVDNCPAKPEGILAGRRTSIILASNQPIELRDRAVNNEYIGYTFQARSGQKLSYNTADNICIWGYAPNNQILSTNVESLPITGEYKLQIAARQKSVSNFTLQVGLDVPQPSFKSSRNNSIQPSNQSYQWWQNNIFIPIIVNIASTVILIFLGGNKLKDIETLVREREIDQEIGVLKKFFIPLSASSSSTERYKIILFGEGNINDIRINYKLSAGFDILRSFLRTWVAQEVESRPTRRRTEGENKLNSDYFSSNDNIIILGAKSNLEKIDEFYQHLGINWDGDDGNINRSIIVRIINPYTKKIIIILDDNSQGLGILGAAKLITTPRKYHRLENITQFAHQQFIDAVNSDDNFQLSIIVEHNHTQFLSTQHVKVRLDRDRPTQLALTDEKIQEAIRMIC
ncbi:MAG: hypothetical protein ACFKPT_05980 [Gloeotrichia echinulata GP01]